MTTAILTLLLSLFTCDSQVTDIYVDHDLSGAPIVMDASGSILAGTVCFDTSVTVHVASDAVAWIGSTMISPGSTQTSATGEIEVQGWDGTTWTAECEDDNGVGWSQTCDPKISGSKCCTDAGGHCVAYCGGGRKIWITTTPPEL